MKTVEPITWETYKPLEFPCVRCGEAEAEFIVTIDNFNLPLCPACAELPEGELVPRKEVER